MSESKATIKTLDQVAHSSLLPLLSRGWAELEAAGYSSGSCPFAWDHHVVYAEVRGKIVGAIAWKRIDWNKDCFIGLGYVLPKFRRRGIYRQMYDRLIELAIDAGCRTISGIVDAKNEAIQRTAEKLGRTAVAITYQTQLPERPPVEPKEQAK